MSESYRIVGEPAGEPLPTSRVGVRVLVPPSGCPSERWSRVLSGHLVNEFTGHAAVGHLRLNGIVQADQLVLDGVEAPEAPQLGGVLRRAIDATNDAVRAFVSGIDTGADGAQERGVATPACARTAARQFVRSRALG